MAYAFIQRGSSGNVFLAVPVTGSSFSIPSEMMKTSHLAEGQQLSEVEFFSLLEKVHRYTCRKKALAFLTTREHARAELHLKLVQKGIPVDIIQETLDRLEEEHLLSDERFSEQFIAFRQRRNPEGAPLLIMRLTQKGIDRTVAQKVVYSWFSDDEAVKNAIIIAARKIQRRAKSHDIKQLLKHRGFSIEHIEDALASEE